jgi:hypothetical protein
MRYWFRQRGFDQLQHPLAAPDKDGAFLQRHIS